MLDFMMELLNKFASAMTKLLPVSPFQRYIRAFSNLPYLGYLNWFIPVGTLVKIGVAWLGVIAVFYLYGIIMRWLKMIGD